jgi:SAM-dependent methyltransferase
MDWQQKTTQVYDDSAEELAAYFSGIGSRVDDIERAISLAGTADRVVEIGCGDGRDASEIIKRVSWYEGFDPSKGLLDIARRHEPETSFVQADASSYAYPDNLDIVFAFASLLHVDRTELPSVFARVAQALRQGGIFYVSLKNRPEYAEEVKKDQYGERMFYYYNPHLIEELMGKDFTTVYVNEYSVGETDWFTMVLRRN